jgi:tetratricopeptide (TPR) repeat protein
VTTPKPTPAIDHPENAFETFLARGLEWINDHQAEVAAGLIAAILLGGATAGIWEWLGARERGSAEALAKVEVELVRELGGDPLANNGFAPALLGEIVVPTPLEPADQSRATAARETALKSFAAVADEHSGTFAATVAQIRAAEIEVELKRFAEADTRLVALIDGLGSSDPVRGVALHMRGSVLESLDRAQEAAQVYADAGAIEEYPGRIQAWIAAAQTYERLGMRERTLESYDAVRVIAPEFAEQAGLMDRIEDLRQAVGSTAAPAPAAAAN